jgi:transmembrane protein EpsG
MITVAIFNSVVVFFASLAKSNKCDYWLKISFLLIFLFLALRYNYGNDYHGYLEAFYTIKYLDVTKGFEPGWQLLCLLFKPLGFFAMMAFLAALNCFVIYRFIKKYIPHNYYWLAVFYYVFSPQCMLIQSSSMRQTVAIIIFLFSIDFLLKKDFVRYSICVLVAFNFHSSALILFALILPLLVNIKINNFFALILFVIYPALYLYIDSLSGFLSQFTSVYFDSYYIYIGNDKGEINSGLGFLFNLFIYLIVVYFARFQEDERLLLFKLAIIGYMTMPFSFLNSMAGRIGTYFWIFNVTVIAILLSDMKRYDIKYLILAGYMFIALMSFYYFFQSPVWAPYFTTYNTIFSAQQIY